MKVQLLEAWTGGNGESNETVTISPISNRNFFPHLD